MAGKSQRQGPHAVVGDVCSAALSGRYPLLCVRAFHDVMAVFYRHAIDRARDFCRRDQLFAGREHHSVQYLVGFAVVGAHRRGSRRVVRLYLEKRRRARKEVLFAFSTEKETGSCGEPQTEKWTRKGKGTGVGATG